MPREASAAGEGDQEGMRALEARLAELIEGYRVPGEYAVAVTDLQTGETIAVNGDRLHLSACGLNLMVLGRTVLDLQMGRTKQAEVDALIAQTIYSSNPVTARDLYVIAGKGRVKGGVYRVGALMRQIGMERSVLDHPPGYGSDSLGLHSDNWMTAREANRALAWIWDGDLTAEWREYLLAHLRNVKPGLNYLVASTPGGKVSHKNGFFPARDGTYVDNDLGIVRFEVGGREYAYALSFFSQWVPQKYGDIELGQAVAREAWAYFQQRYNAP